MPDPGPLTTKIRVTVAASDVDACTWVFVSSPSKDNYRLIIPTRDVRAIAAALTGEINAHPDQFPVTDTRRVERSASSKRT